MNFKNKVVVITGGAGGIGSSIVKKFTEQEARVVFLDIDHEKAEELKTSLENKVHYIHCDLRKEDDIKNAVENIVNNEETIDILINNAAMGWSGDIYSRSIEEWDEAISVNLRAPYILSKYCAPYLTKGRKLTGENIEELKINSYFADDQGVIINIASTRALMSEPDSEPYSAAKGGLLALTHSLAVSLGPWVRVNAVSPGWIDVSRHKMGIPEKLSINDQLQHPAGRVGIPEDISEMCLYLASDKASFITGANFVIDGGMTVKMIYE
ncbi:MAG: SDR family oxidoreductase [Kosmotoga sp.]|nr:MAG: SDR family oxidoreductase [Kosmotoga sp.]